jgi:hypothetical protein
LAVRKISALVSSAACIHRIPPRVRDDRDTPLVSAKSARMCERAVLQNRPSLELSPLRPKGGRAW